MFGNTAGKLLGLGLLDFCSCFQYHPTELEVHNGTRITSTRITCLI